MKILLIAYDNDSHISYFPLGLAYIASACQTAGHEVEIYNQDIYHWPESHLTNFLDSNKFDVAGIGVIGGYYQFGKLLKISEAINKSKQRPFFILGNSGPSPEPEYFLRKVGANAVVVGEGEETVKDLLGVLSEGKKLSDVNGIAYIDQTSGTYIKNQKRELINDVDRIPMPAWNLFPMEHYVLKRWPGIANHERSMCLVSGRGCSFKCNFCYRMDKGLRIRSPESIVGEMLILKEKYGVSYFEFFCELLMNSEQRVVALCNAFLEKLPGINWGCSGRLNYAKLSLLQLMKRAGCSFIDYGIESVDDVALRNMGKALTVKQILAGVENTLSAGISPGFNIIFGNIGETADNLRKDVEFLLKYDDHSQLRTIRPVTPYPGSPLYYYAIRKGLLKGPADFYESKHTNSDLVSINFTDMPIEEIHRLLLSSNKTLIEAYYAAQQKKALQATENLYLKKDVSFRGFRPV